MEKKVFFGIILVSLIVVFFAGAFAFPGEERIGIFFDTNRLTIEPGQSGSVVVSLQNYFFEKKCITLKTSTSSYQNIEAILPQGIKTICLNEGESTKFGLTVRAFDDAANNDYIIYLKAIDAGNSFENSFNATVEEGRKEIDLIAFEKTLCRNKFGQAISVLVKNNSNNRELVRLSAESERFLPYFEPKEIELDSREQRYVEIKLNLNDSTPTGSYSIPIVALANGKKFETIAAFGIADCETPKERILDLLLEKNCIPIEKGKSKTVSFKVKNLSNEFQTVTMASTGSLLSTLSRNLATIKPNGTITVDLNLHAENATSGTHKVEVWAWNDADRIGSQYCIEVGKIHDFSVAQLNDNPSIKRDEAGIISFEITNTGDYSETIKTIISNTNPNVTISLQNPSISIAIGETKTAFVVISPNLNASTGLKEATITFSASGKSVAKKIFFTIEKETTEKKINIIRAVQYPEKIVAKEGQKTDYYITIENPTNERITGINVIITGLPSGISASAITGISLNPKEKRKLNGTIEFGAGTKGTYKAAFEITNSDYKTSVPFEITVEDKEEGTISGLWGMATNLMLGILAIVVIMIAVLLFEKNNNTTKNIIILEKRPRELWQNPIAKP